MRGAIAAHDAAPATHVLQRPFTIAVALSNRAA